MPHHLKRPDYLKLAPFDHAAVGAMNGLMGGLGLHTVCESARCPNRMACFAGSTATFLILGDVCTRHCAFCAIKNGQPLEVDPAEPERIVSAVKKLGLKYVVITSVTRDDLPDGGAAHFAAVIGAIRAYDPSIPVEVLIPDFGGSLHALLTVVEGSPAVLNHNLETVPRLYGEARPEADYRRSLELLRQAKVLDARLLTKSGIMLGLGETKEEVVELMRDLRKAGCDILTIGQYLQPSLRHHEVLRYAPPEEYEEYQATGLAMGFASVVAGPLVRSSFHASQAHASVVAASGHVDVL